MHSYSYRVHGKIGVNDCRMVSQHYSVTSEAIHLKCKMLMQNSWAYKSPQHCRNQSDGSPLGGGRLFTVEIFNFWRPRSYPCAPIGAKFCTGQADPLCPQPYQISRESVQRVAPLRGENADFRAVSIFNTGSLPLRGNPAGNDT